jgi:hypothetical protein
MYRTEITVNGKVIPVKFGSFVVKCLEDDGIKLADLSERVQEKFVDTATKIVYYGAVNATEGKSGEGVSIDDVYDWLDEKGMLSEDVTKVTQLFFKQLSDGVPKTQAKKK